jgi:predicted DNA-binding transcriptional regulator AlpA
MLAAGGATMLSEGSEQHLGWREVQPLLGGISRTTAWRGVRDGWLPSPVRISPDYAQPDPY